MSRGACFHRLPGGGRVLRPGLSAGSPAINLGIPDYSFNDVDTSRNASRRYCSNTCASRSTVAAYRARKATG